MKGLKNRPEKNRGYKISQLSIERNVTLFLELPTFLHLRFVLKDAVTYIDVTVSFETPAAARPGSRCRRATAARAPAASS